MRKTTYYTVQAEVTDLRSEPTWRPFCTNGHDRRRESQLLQGTCLHGIQEKDGWIEVEVPYQKRGEGLAPYRGWVYSAHVSPSSDCSCISPGAEGSVQDLIDRAKSYLGTPYLWGGMSFAGMDKEVERGIDCSALVYQAFLTAGMVLPRNASDQYRVGHRIEKLLPGDLIFMGNPTIYHVLLWDGEQLIEATDLEEGVVRSISFSLRFNLELEKAYDGVETEGGKLFFRRLLSPAAGPA